MLRKNQNLYPFGFLFAIVAFFLAITSFAQEKSILTFNEYLDQVKGKNLSYLAADQNAEAYELMKEKAKVVTAINFFASTQDAFTEQNQALQFVRYSKVYNRNSQIGISQDSAFGLNTKLYYSLNHATYKNLNTSTSLDPSLARSNYQGIPTLEASLSLWQNRSGKMTRALRDSIQFENESQKMSAKAISITSLVSSEQSYWELVSAQKITKIQQGASNAAAQILSYVTRRAAMNLGERGDVLQAKALVESKRLLLLQAQNYEKIAARNFNKQRFLDSNEVQESLVNIDFAALQNFLVPQIRAGNRFEIKAEEAMMKSVVASAQVEEEKNKPSLNLYGSYFENNVEKSTSSAISNSFDKQGRSAMIGIKLAMPINFGMSYRIRDGAAKSASAAKMNYRQKVFEQENDWNNLIQNLQSYKENLKLALAIEAVQKDKLENERRLLRQGRTSTYQILLFEQDYSNSQLTTVQIANQFLSLIAEQKLYGN